MIPCGVLAGLSGGPCGASPLQSNLTQEIWLWLNIFNHFPSSSHQQSMPQPSAIEVPIPRKHPSQVRIGKPGQAILYCVCSILGKLLSPWHAKCQLAGSLALSCLFASSLQFSFPLLRPAQKHKSKLSKGVAKVIQSSLLENTYSLHRWVSWRVISPLAGRRGEISSKSQRTDESFPLPRLLSETRKAMVISGKGLIWWLLFFF